MNVVLDHLPLGNLQKMTKADLIYLTQGFVVPKPDFQTMRKPEIIQWIHDMCLPQNRRSNMDPTAFSLIKRVTFRYVTQHWHQEVVAGDSLRLFSKQTLRILAEGMGLWEVPGVYNKNMMMQWIGVFLFHVIAYQNNGHLPAYP